MEDLREPVKAGDSGHGLGNRFCRPLRGLRSYQNILPRVSVAKPRSTLGSVVEDLREPVKRATVAIIEAIVSAAHFAG